MLYSNGSKHLLPSVLFVKDIKYFFLSKEKQKCTSVNVLYIFIYNLHILYWLVLNFFLKVM